MPVPFFQVDAFAAAPFGGNPAAVVLLADAADPRWMQQVAREMNLSETAFLVARGDGGFDLRWFTPAVEVDLCGHATLASAHVLWQEGRVEAHAAVRFHTRSGPLGATRAGDWIELDFPARPAAPAAAPADLGAMLGALPRYAGRSRDDYLVLVDSEAEVRALRPDFAGLRALGTRGVIVTAAAVTPGFDFVSRFFAPGAGIDEDPVTGSAHCTLGPFWQERLGRRELTAYQASARGGVVKVRVAGERVALGGQAVTVARGELLA
ncbi:MAG TPA: PhzF family phenazine biosynthesis protein [Polyangia bacterium]|jgi:PhzF family phenazine biosynthesis protein